MKTKKPGRKAIIIIVIIAAAAVAAGIICASVFFAPADESVPVNVVSAQAESSDLVTTVSGSGTLKDEGAVAVTVPEGVQILEYHVHNNQEVAEGDSLATVDRVSVMNTVAEVEETLDYLEGEIEKASDVSGTQTIKAVTDGRVMKIFATEGDDAGAAMTENGALMLVSLDGMMACDIECDSELIAGDAVSVVKADGSEISGKVSSNLNGKITVTVSDEKVSYGEQVTVRTEDGTELGNGTMYINSEWKATATEGTVSSVSVSEGQKVSKGNKLLTLTGISTSADFELYTAQHRVYEQILKELFVLYQNQTICADNAGFVTGINEDLLIEDNSGYKGLTLLAAANTPTGEDFRDFVNYAAVVKEVSEDGIYCAVSDEPVEVTDYMNIVIDPNTKTTAATVGCDPLVPVFSIDESSGTKVWKTGTLQDIKTGDKIVFTFDENDEMVWIVVLPESGDTPGGEDPEVDPEVDPEDDDGGGYSDDSMNDGSISLPSSLSSYQGTSLEESVFELYTENESIIMTLTANEKMLFKVTVDEYDILSIEEGQDVEITVTAIPGRTFSGKVSEINTTGTNKGGNTKYTVTVLLDRDEDMLSGMNATAVITLGKQEGAVSIPTAALYDEGTKTYVYTSFDEKNGLGGKTEVTTGASDGMNTEITEGLEKGQTVYYEYTESVAPDMSA